MNITQIQQLAELVEKPQHAGTRVAMHKRSFSTEGRGGIGKIGQRCKDRTFMSTRFSGASVGSPGWGTDGGRTSVSFFLGLCKCVRSIHIHRPDI